MEDIIQMKEEDSNKEQRRGRMPKLIGLKLATKLKTEDRGIVTIIEGINTK